MLPSCTKCICYLQIRADADFMPFYVKYYAYRDGAFFARARQSASAFAAAALSALN